MFENLYHQYGTPAQNGARFKEGDMRTQVKQDTSHRSNVVPIRRPPPPPQPHSK